MDYLFNLLYTLEIILGIGFLIFVHELGHFLFAKRHGVRVETFSLGFGPRIWGFKRGETDYTIRAIPLGGYVKMAGENPDEVRTGAADELGSKSVWARFQIFVAGTASNFVWAFPIMILAFLVGKESAAPYVGDVRPDTAEWTSDLQAGDELVSVGGTKILAFEDYIKEIVRRPKGDSLEVVYRRNGEERKTKVTVGTAKQIGIGPISTMVAEVEKGKPAEKAGFKKRDEIVAIDGVPVIDAGEIASLIDRSAGKEMEFKVKGSDGAERVVKATPGVGEAKFTFGMGAEAAPPLVGVVRPGSPAAQAGLQAGDLILSVGGVETPSFQSVTAIVRAKASQKLDLVVQRGEEKKSISVTAGSQGGRGFLGISPEPSSLVASVQPDSPMAKAGLKPGDRILTVDGKEVRPSAKPSPEDMKKATNTPEPELYLSLSQIEMQAERKGAKGEKIQLGIKRGNESLTLDVAPEKKGDGDLGIRLQHKTVILRPGFLGAVKRGSAEALDVFVLTFQMLRKLVAAEEEASNLSGPVGIMSASYKSAKEGFGNLLWLLGLISVNLAVINLLPIPILDGGHIMFLFIEKLRGKPVTEKILYRAQLVGLILLLTLVVFVTVHDFRRLFT